MSIIARYDKYDPISGGFRAPLAAAITDPAQIAVPLAMSLDGQGRAVIGTAGAGGFCGVYVADQAKAVGDIADIMTAGEIVDLDEDDFSPGSRYAAAADGALDGVVGTDAGVGWTVGDRSTTTGEVRSRLVVRVSA